MHVLPCILVSPESILLNNPRLQIPDGLNYYFFKINFSRCQHRCVKIVGYVHSIITYLLVIIRALAFQIPDKIALVPLVCKWDFIYSVIDKANYKGPWSSVLSALWFSVERKRALDGQRSVSLGIPRTQRCKPINTWRKEIGISRYRSEIFGWFRYVMKFFNGKNCWGNTGWDSYADSGVRADGTLRQTSVKINWMTHLSALGQSA